MDLLRTGVVLLTERYEECVAFYEDVVGLRVLFSKQELTCFAFGDSYLMVEGSGFAHPTGKAPAQNPTRLRFNVADIRKAADELAALGVETDYQAYPWGTVAKFFDPDGNQCELRDEETFRAQWVTA